MLNFRVLTSNNLVVLLLSAIGIPKNDIYVYIPHKYRCHNHYAHELFMGSPIFLFIVSM